MIAVGDPQLAPRAVAVGIDRRLGHAQFAGDLFGAEMLVHQAETIALTLREQFDSGRRDLGVRLHLAGSKQRILRFVYFDGRDCG